MPDVTAAELVEWLRPVADESDEANIQLGSLHLRRILVGLGDEDDWVGNFAGTDAADIAAMCLVRRLKAEGWVPSFWPNTVQFWNGRDHHEEGYEKHPCEALARFAARSKK